MSTSDPASWDRPLEQWKVTELKEELKRRKLTTRGLKEELVRRLDDAIKREDAEAKDKENGFDVEGESHDVQTEVNLQEPVNEEHGAVEVGHGGLVSPTTTNSLHSDEIRDDKIVEFTDCGVITNKSAPNELNISHEGPKLEASFLEDTQPTDPILVSQVPEEVSKKTVNSTVELESIDFGLVTQVSENVPEKTDSCNAESKDEVPAVEMLITSKSTPQVPDTVHQVVKCEYASTDYVSIKQENKLKDNSNTDSVPVELEATKTEMLPSDNAQDSTSVVDHEGGGERVAERRDVFYDIGVDPVEKDGINVQDGPNLNERAIEEPVGQEETENKNLDISVDDNGGNQNVENEKSVPIDEQKCSDTTMMEMPAEEKYGFVDSLESSLQVGEKRKTDGVEVEVDHEPPKRQRRWNADPEQVKTVPSRPARLEREHLNLPDTTSQTSPVAVSGANASTPRDKIRAAKILARSDSNIDSETPKERVVPPSQRSPTTSLRVDRFLRPFTLKAVQELVAKTGTVSSFWMDHIKTHCYVTYSSVSEAIATRDALYSLQWPPNGGRCLTAEFVEPEDVKARMEGGQQQLTAVAPPPIPSPQPNQVINVQPSAKMPPQPNLSASLKQQQQLPPPPPLKPQTRPLQAIRERLPPPPPPPKKVEAPVLTLDDLFKKTRATPRIYYLPLSEEQVAAKLAANAAAAGGRNRGPIGQPRN